MKRINNIDFVRGLVMVIMALDHVRDFMHTTSMSQDPTNLQTTTTVLFLTRWVTHLCAPTFVFLSGVSAYISLKRHDNISESRTFLFNRGIWLIILEFTIINFALWYDIHFHLLIMEVISTIGFSFIVLSFLLKIPSRIIGITGLLILFFHNLLPGMSYSGNPILSYLASVLFHPNLIRVTPNFTFYVAYPLIPWLGILLTGFASGQFFELRAEKRKKIFLQIGFAALLLFCLIRFINIYGDPSKWSVQRTTLFTFLSFINTTKYPPSLLFVLLFLGITFLILFISDEVKNRFTDIFSVYGKVPLFYFIIHLFLIHSLMFVMLFVQGVDLEELRFGVFNNGRPVTGSGIGLSSIYLIWFGVVVILYPLCRWYGIYKAANKDNKLLRYL